MLCIQELMYHILCYSLILFRFYCNLKHPIVRDGKNFLLSGTIENIEKNFCKKIEKM